MLIELSEDDVAMIKASFNVCRSAIKQCEDDLLENEIERYLERLKYLESKLITSIASGF
jgi:hypothetical protein